MDTHLKYKCIKLVIQYELKNLDEWTEAACLHLIGRIVNDYYTSIAEVKAQLREIDGCNQSTLDALYDECDASEVDIY